MDKANDFKTCLHAYVLSLCNCKATPHLISMVMIKYPKKKQLRGDRSLFHFAIPGCSLSLWRSEIRNVTSTVKNRKMNACNLTYLCSSSFIYSYQFRTYSLGNVASHSGLGLPTSIVLIKALSYRHVHWTTQCRHCFPETSFPGDTMLPQVDN